MSNWTIGKVNLPVAPEVVTYTNEPGLLKTKSLFLEAPWVFNLGPNNELVQLDGEIFSGNMQASAIYTNYVSVLDDYSKRHGNVPMMLMFNGTGNWATNGAVTTFKPTAGKYVKYNRSTYVDFGATSRYVYYNFPTAMDFSSHNLVSLWLYGIGTEKFKLTFYKEQFAGKTNGYRFYPQSSGAQWYQRVFTPSSLDGTKTPNVIGSPSWNKIRSVVLEASNYAGGAYVDMMIIGMGWEYADPDRKKKGIGLISRWEARRNKGDIRSYQYRLQITDASEYYGLKKWAK